MNKKIQTKSSSRLVPILVAVVVTVAGIAALVSSHAAAPSTSTTHAAVLDSSSVMAAPGISVGGLIVGGINFVNPSQVTYVGPGAKLNYSQGIKGALSHCYYVMVQPDKSGSGSATANFVGNGKIIAQAITYNSADPNSLTQVCVGQGKAANPGYSIYNTSTTQSLIVYQDVVTY